MQGITLISQLPPDIRQLAELNREREYGLYGYPDDPHIDYISGAFIWANTPEGAAFWHSIVAGSDILEEEQNDDQIIM